MTHSDVLRLRRALVRFNALIFASVFGLLMGLGLGACTLFLILQGGSDPGATLSLLVAYLPGYSVSGSGAIVGFFEVSLLAACLSYGPAWIYYQGVLRSVQKSSVVTSEEALLHTTARVHVPTFAASFGLFSGGILFIATLWLVVRHQPGTVLGPHLGLLRYYLPGYTVSVPGAFLGFAYMFGVGTVSFALVGWIYNWMVRSQRSHTGLDE